MFKDNVSEMSTVATAKPHKRGRSAKEPSAESAPPLQRAKTDHGWVREPGTEGWRHIHHASGRVMLEVCPDRDNSDGSGDSEAKQTRAPDMVWKQSPRIVIAAMRGDIAMAR